MKYRDLLSDDVMREVLIVLPPPDNFAEYAEDVRDRLIAHLEWATVGSVTSPDGAPTTTDFPPDYRPEMSPTGRLSAMRCGLCHRTIGRCDCERATRRSERRP
jgi:hypothetical protein